MDTTGCRYCIHYCCLLGLARTVCIYTVCDCIFGDVPVKNKYRVYTVYISATIPYLNGVWAQP